VVAGPMGDEYWKPFLQEGETVVWSGRASAWHLLPYYAALLTMILMLAFPFGYYALMYPTVEQYCANVQSPRCPKSFQMAWPTVVILTCVVVFGLLGLLFLAIGWIRQDMALTQKRALLIVTFPWQRAPGSLYHISLANEAFEGWGDVRFSGHSSYFRFNGLSPSERSRVVYLSGLMKKALTP
jgi:hypothetical protein